MKLKAFDTTPQTQRRAMTVEEVHRLLAVCPPYRRLLWETALLSGLRANELRHLSVAHLDVEQHGLHLEANWTKNRKRDFLPLPHILVHRLHTFAITGEALQRYRHAYVDKSIPSSIPTTPLLYVPRDPARELDKDLQAAGIPKCTREGKIDFHALRVAYINFVIDSGGNAKDVQDLARHATLTMTTDYARTRNMRLVQTVEWVADQLLPAEESAADVPHVRPVAVGDVDHTKALQRLSAKETVMPKGGM